MSASRFRRRPPASLVVAVLALFVALGGTAEALHGHNTVRSDDIVNGTIVGHDIADKAIKTPKIKDGAVNSAKIKDEAVNSAKTHLIGSSVIPTASATTASSPTDLGGPNVTVTVPAGGIIEVFAQADISSSGGGQNATGRVDLFEPTLVPTPESIMSTQSNAFQTRRTAPGSNDSDGAINITRGGWLSLLAPPGTYTFSLRYEADNGGTATFQNRALAVRVTR